MIEAIANLVFSVVETIREERRTRFKEEYHEILTALNEAKNAPSHLWANSTIDLLDQKLETFLIALGSEVKNEVSSNS